MRSVTCAYIRLHVGPPFSRFVPRELERWKGARKRVHTREENWLASSQWRAGLRRRPWDPLFRITASLNRISERISVPASLCARDCVGSVCIHTFPRIPVHSKVDRRKSSRRKKNNGNAKREEKKRDERIRIPFSFCLCRCVSAYVSRFILHVTLVHERSYTSDELTTRRLKDPRE